MGLNINQIPTAATDIQNLDKLYLGRSPYGTTNDRYILGSSIKAQFVLASAVGSMAFENSNAVVITGGTINGVSIGNITPGTGDFSALSASTADILGGTIEDTIIGGAIAAAGTFTSVTTKTITFPDVTTAGLELGQRTTAQINAIVSPQKGWTAFDTDLNVAKVYNGTSWVTGGGSSSLGTMAYQNANAVAITGGSGTFDALQTQIGTSGLYTEVQDVYARTGISVDIPISSAITVHDFMMFANSFDTQGDYLNYFSNGEIVTTATNATVILKPQVTINGTLYDLQTAAATLPAIGNYAYLVRVNASVNFNSGTIKLAVDWDITITSTSFNLGGPAWQGAGASLYTFAFNQTVEVDTVIITSSNSTATAIFGLMNGKC